MLQLEIFKVGNTVRKQKMKHVMDKENVHHVFPYHKISSPGAIEIWV